VTSYKLYRDDGNGSDVVIEIDPSSVSLTLFEHATVVSSDLTG
jgi:hypothetical protein